MMFTRRFDRQYPGGINFELAVSENEPSDPDVAQPIVADLNFSPILTDFAIDSAGKLRLRPYQRWVDHFDHE